MDIDKFCREAKGLRVGNACIVGKKQKDSPFTGTPKELADEINKFFHRKMKDTVLSVGLTGFGDDLDVVERFQVVRNVPKGIRSVGIVSYAGNIPIPKLKPRAKLVKNDTDFTEEEIAEFQKYIGGSSVYTEWTKKDAERAIRRR